MSPRLSARLEPTLNANVEALRTRGDDLAERLLEVAHGDHVIVGGPTPPLYRVHNELREFTLSARELETSVADVRDGDDVFLFGMGLGAQVAHILRTRPQCNVVVWDRDPWLLRLALSRQDYRRSIESGRLRLALGVDLLDHLDELPGRRVVFHRFLRALYADELRLVDEAMEEGAASDHRWCGLAMGGRLAEDVGEALRDAGYSIFPLELKRWSPQETARAIERLRPERVVTINYAPGSAELCARFDVPLTVWEADPTTERLPRVEGASGHVRIFTFRERHVGVYEDLGFRHVEHLPLGADTTKRRPMVLTPAERERYGSRVAFVGSSLAAGARRYRRLFRQLVASWDSVGIDDFDDLESRLDGVLDVERDDFSVYRVEEEMERSFGDFLAAARAVETRGDPLKWVAEIAASEKRVRYVKALGRFGVSVWGDAEWREADYAKAGVHYRDEVGHHDELTKVYCGGAIHVDVNRLYQPDVVPLRVFDVLACGGFLIAEHSDELARLFAVGEELESYRTLDELVGKVEHYLEHPDEARAIAERGLAAVRERHTIRQRVARMLAAGT